MPLHGKHSKILMVDSTLKKNQAGIYKIQNVHNENFYIGSSINLYRRYYEHMADLKHGINFCGVLQRAYNKWGNGSLKFTVLFLCDPDKCAYYEQRALDVYKPEYNRSKSATAAFGFKLSKEAKRKISLANRGENHGNSKLTLKQVNEIIKLVNGMHLTHKEVALKFSVNQSTVTRIINGKRWGTVNKNVPV